MCSFSEVHQSIGKAFTMRLEFSLWLLLLTILCGFTAADATDSGQLEGVGLPASHTSTDVAARMVSDVSFGSPEMRHPRSSWV